MTVSSQTRKAGPYSGTGSTGPFTFSFKVFEASDLLVVKVNNSTNVETTLTLTTDYTVSLNADQNANPGGTITLVAALAVGYNMVISSQVPYLQETDLTNQGGFYPEVITDALDKLTIEVQQLKIGVDSSAKLPITSTADADSLSADIIRLADSADNIDTVANDLTNINAVAANSTNINAVAGNAANINAVAGNATNINAVNANSANINTVASNITSVNTVALNIADVHNFADVYQGAFATDPTVRTNGGALQTGDLYYNTTNNVFRVYGTGVWVTAVSPAPITVNVQRFSGNGSTTVFTLSSEVTSTYNAEVYISGVAQTAGVDYTAASTTLTFASAPPSGTNNIMVRWFTPISIANAVQKTDDTGAALLPNGTTAQRPATPSTGMFRYNSTNGAFEGYSGSAWTGVGGASGGGGNPFVYENDAVVTADYTITAGKNAMSAGPITINSGVTVTVPSNSVWIVV